MDRKIDKGSRASICKLEELLYKIYNVHVVPNIVSHFSYYRSVPLPHPLPPKVTNHKSVLLGLENQRTKWMEGQVEAKLLV